MVESSSTLLAALKDEAGRIEEDCLYSSRGHFAAAGRWSRVHFWLGLPAATGAAFAGVSAVGQDTALAVILSGIVTALTATLTFLNPSDKSSVHHTAGTRFNALRGQARRYREIGILEPDSMDSLRQELSDLAKSRDDLNTGSPQIPRWAFEAGRRSLLAGEADYEVDKHG